MSLQKKVAGFVLGSGAAQAAIILRGILIARFIGAENMGIAATFVAVTTFIELLSTTGADRFLVQDPEGGEPKAAGTLHAIGAIRGVVLCIILAAIALPAAKLFEAETAIVGYFALALVPLIRGLQSVDPIVQQRALKTRATILVELYSQVFALVAGATAAYVLGDWRAAIVAVLVQAFIAMLATHAFATRPWNFTFDRELATRSFRFATPLFVSGVLLFFALQGDRIAISIADRLRGESTYTLADLGRYAVAGSIALLPIRTCANLARSVFLPWIIQSECDEVAARRRRDVIVLFAMIAVCYALVAATIGGELLTLLFGKEFGDMSELTAILCAAQGIRMLRVTSNVAAMARGDSMNTMFGAFGRTSGVVVAIAFAIAGLPLSVIASAAVFGELVALGWCEISLRRRHGIRAGPTAGVLVGALAVLGASVLGSSMQFIFNGWVALSAGLGVLGAMLAIGWCVSATVRSECRGVLSAVRGRAV